MEDMYLKYGTKYMPENMSRRENKMYAVELHNLSKTYPGGNRRFRMSALRWSRERCSDFSDPTERGRRRRSSC